MTSVFTDYVRSLADSGEPPSSQRFDELLQALRGALVHEMRRRFLWQAPPSYLGYIGATSWNEEDLFTELALDCYEYIFFKRLGALRARLDLANLDGLIFRNIRNFLHEARRRHDPIGARLYGIAHDAVERLLDANRLHVLSGGSRPPSSGRRALARSENGPALKNHTALNNNTVLGFHPNSDGIRAETAQLSEYVPRWNDDLLPDLMIAWNRDGVINRLAEALATLPDTGVEAFAFKSLVEPFQRDVRMRWQAVWVVTGPETVVEYSPGEGLAELVRLVRPDSGFEQRQLFSLLVECVDRRIENHDARRKTLDHLRRLWLYLRHQAAESEAESGVGAPPEMPDVAELSQKGLGNLLGIPRLRIPELRHTLGGMVEKCRGVSSRRPTATIPADGGEPSLPPGGLVPSFAAEKGIPAMSLEERREKLRLRTGEAARSGTSDNEERAAPRPGDVFLVPECGDSAIDWVVLTAGKQGLLVVPADDFGLIGSDDVRLELTDGGFRFARCRHGLWIAPEALAAARRIGNLAAASLEQARRQRLAADSGQLSGSFEQRDVDQDMEHKAWMKTVAAARDILALKAAGPEAKVLRHPSADGGRWRVRKMVESLAAVILILTTAGLYLAQRGTIRDLTVERESLRTQTREKDQRLAGYEEQLGEMQSRQSDHEATIAELERRLDEETQPSVGPGARVAPQILRSPGERGTRLDSVTMPANADLLVLLVEIVAAEAWPRYRGEILERATGRVVATDEDLVPVGAAFVTVTLHRSQLRTGDYLIHIDAVAAAGTTKRIENYELQITLEK